MDDAMTGSLVINKKSSRNLPALTGAFNFRGALKPARVERQPGSSDVS